jgi:hypothetical protein
MRDARARGRQEAAMDHVIASGPADVAEADRLAELLRASGLPGKFECVTIEDETGLEASLAQDKDGASTYVLLVSQDFAERIRSLVALDGLLGTLLLGRRRVLVACLPEDEMPPRDLMSVVNRHDGIVGETSLEGLARRVTGRLARIHINTPAAPQVRGAPGSSPTMRRWLVGAIVLLLALLGVMIFQSLGKGRP